MLFFITGPIGSGKTTIGSLVSTQTHIPLYEMDNLKKILRTPKEGFADYLRSHRQFPESRRQEIYQHAILERHNIAQASAHLIVCDIFYTAIDRTLLLQAAEQIFGGYRIITLQTDHQLIVDRLSVEQRENHILSDPVSRLEALKDDIDPLAYSDLNVQNTNTPQQVSNIISEYICSQLA